jgi:L-fucose isomerase-like protein
MRKIGLIKLRSVMSQSDPSLNQSEEAFLDSINKDKLFQFAKPRKEYLNVFYIETGGSEIYFKQCYSHYDAPYYLLVQGERNSLASSLEILTFLQQKGLEGHLIMGSPEEIHHELDLYSHALEVKHSLNGVRLGVIGSPSDWLIASSVDYKAVKKKFGIDLIDIPMKELFVQIAAHKIADEDALARLAKKTKKNEDLRESLYIHSALKYLVEKYELKGFTLRCFDLVSKLQETSCLAFGLLNAEGIVCGCEGDVPSLLTMYLLKALTGQSVFMANPARINVKSKTAVYAHCTCPFDMIASNFTLPTHFESGTGIGIQGNFKKNAFTAAKLNPDLSALRVYTGQIEGNLKEAHLCRSQIQVKFKEDIADLLLRPYGNHLLFIYGDHSELIQRFIQLL